VTEMVNVRVAGLDAARSQPGRGTISRRPCSLSFINERAKQADPA